MFIAKVHRPTEQILLGYFFAWLVIFRGGPGPGARSGPPPLVPGTKLHLVTEQNLLGWTMKVSLVGGALAWGLDPRCPGQRAGFVLWI